MSAMPCSRCGKYRKFQPHRNATCSCDEGPSIPFRFSRAYNAALFPDIYS